MILFKISDFNNYGDFRMNGGDFVCGEEGLFFVFENCFWKCLISLIR